MNIENIFRNFAQDDNSFKTINERSDFLLRDGVERFKIRLVGRVENKIVLKTPRECAQALIDLGACKNIDEGINLISDIAKNSDWLSRKKILHYIRIREVFNKDGEMKYEIKVWEAGSSC